MAKVVSLFQRLLGRSGNAETSASTAMGDYRLRHSKQTAGCLRKRIVGFKPGLCKAGLPK